jgi:hypothetical protein
MNHGYSQNYKQFSGIVPVAADVVDLQHGKTIKEVDVTVAQSELIRERTGHS